MVFYGTYCWISFVRCILCTGVYWWCVRSHSWSSVSLLTWSSCCITHPPLDWSSTRFLLICSSCYLGSPAFPVVLSVVHRRPTSSSISALENLNLMANLLNYVLVCWWMCFNPRDETTIHHISLHMSRHVTVIVLVSSLAMVECRDLVAARSAPCA